MFQLARPRCRDLDEGFSLLEVVVATTVLSIGLMSAALLMGNVSKYSVRSRYVALAAQLASEELEDLNRWPSSAAFVDPHITVPAGSNSCGIAGETCTGSLTADFGPQTITVSGIPTTVSYFDSVCLSTQNGVMSETYEMPCLGPPTGNYVTVAFQPNGQTPQTTCSPNPPSVGMTFDRRWVIEQDQPVPGVRRITVLVTLVDLSIQPPVTFQMSMVRP